MHLPGRASQDVEDKDRKFIRECDDQAFCYCRKKGSPAIAARQAGDSGTGCLYVHKWVVAERILCYYGFRKNRGRGDLAAA